MTRLRNEGYDEAVQRLRVRFSRGEEIKYISHLDLMRLWERVLRRARMPLTYSEGFSPHARISLAAPLPIGTTSQYELMDVVLQEPVTPYFLIQTVKQQLPRGLEVLEVIQVPLTDPSVQSQLRHAEYHVVVRVDKSTEEMQAAIASLLQAKELPWHHMRDTGPRFYDLRALVEHVWLVSHNRPSFILGMSLRCDPQGTGRPEQVAAALGMTEHPLSIHRNRLILAEN